MRRIFEPFLPPRRNRDGWVCGWCRNWWRGTKGHTGVEQAGRAGQRDGVHRVSSLPGSAGSKWRKLRAGQDGRFRCVIDIDPNSGVQDHRADMPGACWNRSAPAARRNFFRSASQDCASLHPGYFPSLPPGGDTLFDLHALRYEPRVLRGFGLDGLSLPSVERRRLRNCQIPMRCRRPSRPRRRRGAGWTICRVPLTKGGRRGDRRGRRARHKRVAEGACRCVDGDEAPEWNAERAGSQDERSKRNGRRQHRGKKTARIDDVQPSDDAVKDAW